MDLKMTKKTIPELMLTIEKCIKHEEEYKRGNESDSYNQASATTITGLPPRKRRKLNNTNQEKAETTY